MPTLLNVQHVCCTAACIHFYTSVFMLWITNAADVTLARFKNPNTIVDVPCSCTGRYLNHYYKQVSIQH